MKLLIGCHFSVIGFSNSYLVGYQDREKYGNKGICVDPGVMNMDLLNLINQHDLEITTVLITHKHESHLQGLRTLCKIFPNVKIYSHKPVSTVDAPTYILDDGDSFTANGIPVTTFLVPGHSYDSLVYRIGDALFTGDTLMSGRIGSTDSSLAKALLLKSISERIYPLEDHCPVFPGHGAPSTLGVEKLFNPETMVLHRVKGKE